MWTKSFVLATVIALGAVMTSYAAPSAHYIGACMFLFAAIIAAAGGIVEYKRGGSHMKRNVAISTGAVVMLLVVAWYSLPSAQAQLPGINHSCDGNGSSYSGSCNNTFNMTPPRRLIPASVSDAAARYFDDQQITGSVTFETEDSCDDCVQLTKSIREIIKHDKGAQVGNIDIAHLLTANYNGVFIAVRDTDRPPPIALAISKALNISIVKNGFPEGYDCAIYVLPYHGS